MQARMIDTEIKMMRQESLRLGHEREQMVDKIADNTTKIKQNKVLPYLVSKVVEVSQRCLLLPSTIRLVCMFHADESDSGRRQRDTRGCNT